MTCICCTLSDLITAHTARCWSMLHAGTWQARATHGEGRMVRGSQAILHAGTWQARDTHGEGRMVRGPQAILHARTWQARATHGKGRMVRGPQAILHAVLHCTPGRASHAQADE